MKSGTEHDQGKHYLQDELETLVKTDPSMWEFLQRGSLDGIWYWDLERPENEYMSPEMWRLFGIDPATKTHNPAEWQDLIFQGDLETALVNFQQHCADPDHPYDQIVRYRHADKSTVWVRCRGVAIRDEQGKPIRMLGAHNDLTAVKRAEQDIKASNQKLVAANTELSSFAYSVSHDLKAPANTLDMVLQELHEHLEATGDKEGLELTGFGISAVTRMKTLVEDVLDYTRVVGQKLAFENVNLTLCIDEILQNLKADIERGSARIHCDELPVIRGNSTQIKLLFQNLITNALKFQEKGASPEINIQCRAENQDGFTIISVSDNGIGVDPTFHDRIFTMFERLHQKEDYPGTGLGLPLCRRIALNHDGEIFIHSEVGKGSTFTIHFSNRLS